MMESWEKCFQSQVGQSLQCRLVLAFAFAFCLLGGLTRLPRTEWQSGQRCSRLRNPPLQRAHPHGTGRQVRGHPPQHHRAQCPAASPQHLPSERQFLQEQGQECGQEQELGQELGMGPNKAVGEIEGRTRPRLLPFDRTMRASGLPRPIVLHK